MRHAVAHVGSHSVDSEFWMNEGHLTAFAHMYRLTVFVFSCALNRWLAYGDNAHSNSGYVCLLSTGLHFDVLHGVDSVIPAIPRQVELQGLGDELSWQTVEVNCDKYTRPFVWKWPHGEQENVSVADTSRGTECSYASVVRRASPQSSAKQVTWPAEPQQTKQVLQVCSDSVDAFHCDVCFRVFTSQRALKIHTTKSHRVDRDGFTVVAGVSQPNHMTGSGKVTATNVFRCGVCDTQCSTQHALSLHYFNEHEVRSVQDIKSLQTRNKHSITVSGNSDWSPELFGNAEVQAKNNIYISCQLCSKSFTSKAGLEMHQIRTHRGKTRVVNNISRPKSSGKQIELTNSTVTAQQGDSSACELEERTEPRAQPEVMMTGKQQCGDCGNLYVNLSNHKKCSKRLLKKAEAGTEGVANTHERRADAGTEAVTGTRKRQKGRNDKQECAVSTESSATAQATASDFSPRKKGTTRKAHTRLTLLDELGQLKSSCSGRRQTKLGSIS